MSKKNCRQRARNVVAKILGARPETLDDETGIGKHGKWDSLGHMKIILALEEEFQVHFDAEKMNKLFNLRSIIEVLENESDG